MNTSTENPPIPKHVLNQAKAFLCWDYDTNLTIQLIPLHGEVAYFFPPTKDRSTIMLFYPADCIDFLHSICYLFHEIGHYEQFKREQMKQQPNSFETEIQNDKGPQRLAFETEAWDLGAIVLHQFLDSLKIDHRNKIGELYNQFKMQCIQSYFD